MSRVIFDPPAWWQQPFWRIAAAVGAFSVAGLTWWAALAPADPEPVAASASSAALANPRPVPSAAPAPALVETRAQIATPAVESPMKTPPPLSTMVAPGVHVTPLSVPPGTNPMPAGPTAHDSEPEN
jgi:hypothetical protein